MAINGKELRAVAAIFGFAESFFHGGVCLQVKCADGEIRTFTGEEPVVPWWDAIATELPPTAERLTKSLVFPTDEELEMIREARRRSMAARRQSEQSKSGPPPAGPGL